MKEKKRESPCYGTEILKKYWVKYILTGGKGFSFVETENWFA